ncbi:Protein ZC39510 [Caligus rogercresseyi]|uniref:Protein ZC39510 n=1 Tax=Caligus rogercresseyi TaxID=217165 RepID=A0A7T8GXF4_CALRO|nr:Protein ZC39510 [Caligus rogercresseyi]
MTHLPHGLSGGLQGSQGGRGGLQSLFLWLKSGDKEPHEVTMDLFGEVIPEETVKVPTDRVIEISLRKKKKDELKIEESTYWPRLLSDKRRMHWLAVDFSKWKDEDSEDEGESGAPAMGGAMDPFKEMSAKGFGGPGSMDLNDLIDLDDNDELDDEEAPGLEK